MKSEVPQKWVTGGHQNCQVGSAFILIQQQQKRILSTSITLAI